VDTGMIAAGDLKLFRFVETAEEAWEVLATHYGFDAAAHADRRVCRRHLSGAPP
jgi:hypothetical protein